ncbi:MAG: hypothetical protein Q8P45_00360 [Candidatus Harrisonbacteria bacterium]|nr:hypothetical protein [Candidatus Harrisonbacteria bacterium]
MPKASENLEKLIKEVERDHKKKRESFAGPFKTKKELKEYLDSLKEE